jgi:hypothetical protein
MKIENLDESWENARKQKNTRLHLIKPMELEMDVDKCIYSDDAILPAYEISLFVLIIFSFLLDGKWLEVSRVWNYVYPINVFFI